MLYDAFIFLKARTYEHWDCDRFNFLFAQHLGSPSCFPHTPTILRVLLKRDTQGVLFGGAAAQCNMKEAMT